MVKISTGISKLDELLQGGFPEKSVILICGPTGSGKTVFACQFMFAGVERGENCVYILSNESPGYIKSYIEKFSWRSTNGKITIVDAYSSSTGRAKGEEKFSIQDISDANEFVEVVRKAIKESSARRVVIDSIYPILNQSGQNIRRIADQIKRIARGMNCIIVITNHTGVGEKGFSNAELEQMADGIIKLDMEEKSGVFKRVLTVWKMRFIEFVPRKFEFQITKNGIEVIDS